MGAAVTLPGTVEEALSLGFKQDEIDAFTQAVERTARAPAKRTTRAPATPQKAGRKPPPATAPAKGATARAASLWSGKMSLLQTIAGRIEALAAEAGGEGDTDLSEGFSQRIYGLAQTIEGIRETQWKRAKVAQLQVKIKEATDLVDDDDAAAFDAIRANMQVLQAKLEIKANHLSHVIESDRRSLPPVHDQVTFWRSLQTIEQFYRDLSNVQRRPRTAP